MRVFMFVQMTSTCRLKNLINQMQMTALENMSVHQRNVQIHADSLVYM